MQIPIKAFEDWFGLSRDTQAFSRLISDIRQELYQFGIYLSGEGATESGNYFIESPCNHSWITKLSLARAERDLEGKQVLMLNTKVEGMSELEKRRHENVLREVSMKLNALRHAQEVEAVLRKRRSKQLPTQTEEGSGQAA